MWAYLVRLTLWASFSAVWLYPYAAFAETCEQPVVQVVSVQGTVESQRLKETQWQRVRLNDMYCAGDQLRVQERSRADVALMHQSVLRLSANTTLTLESTPEERTSVVSLLKGLAHFFSRSPHRLDVRTSSTVAGVRGTEFVIGVEPDQTLLTVYEGTVVASNPAGSLTLTGGQSVVAESGKAPVLRAVARPRDAVQWALYYPPVLYAQPEQLKAGVDWERQVATSMEFYLRGDIQKAFDAIADVPDHIREPRFLAYRASLLLAVGRVEEAQADIERALQLRPNDSDALALQSIIAMVQNDKNKALSLAQQAIQSDANSATARIAMSYAQQARFDLEGTRDTLQQAVALEPANALAWARLAELHASFGNLSKALKAARQAAALEPNLARTQTVLGFAYLTQVKTDKAKAAFAKAIALDQADPLPRLGLGLAIIREGDVNAGSRQIEIAASLAPNDALIRSYLGKAYYEEKRGKLDEREFDIAKQLDPNDPTPWFYSAIAKQTTNRPVEALHNLQKAIELNDNRAVYRSRLLLEADLAARSASLGRIYSDLGFQQLALVEGWKSVNTDPTNFSAHRFLADSYAVLPRHEIARVSELLQSQLLQPINITPIQPLLAESNLFLISASGAGGLSFNEFNPVFNRDRLTLQVSGLAGENDTFAGEGVVAGIYKKLSFSVGYTHFTTDGFRTNSGHRDDIVNAFVQQELTSNTSIQAEYRFRETDVGDIHLRFFPEDFFPGQRNEQETHSIRFGVRHTFSPSSILLGSFTYQDAEDISRDEQRLFEFKGTERAFGGEFQHLFRSQPFNLTSGIGYFDLDGKIRASFGPFEPDSPEILQTIPTDLRHINVYAYGYINLLKNVTFTVGASFDSTRGEQPGAGEAQSNPKFGVMWEPIPGTTLRAAVFRALKRTLITNQTLEPTQVAGFNQFFDDANLTEAWHYGGAIDQKFAKNFFGGVEFAKRDLKVPFLDFTDPENPSVTEADWKEYLGRAYLFWTPHVWFALRAEYLFERFERAEELPAGLTELDTHRVPFGITFFHPSGVSTSLTTTYWNQDGMFQSPLTGELRSGRDDFWLVDAAINYRLPKRYGFISLGVRNLFDQQFKFFDDSDNPVIQPDRVFLARVTLALP